MDGYTLTRDFKRDAVIDTFDSFIWTERYYGNSEVQIVTPATSAAIALLSEGTFVELEGSQEIMILETFNIKEGKLTVKGKSLLAWLNNRAIRATAAHEDRYWNFAPFGLTAGQVMWKIVYDMCVTPGPVGIPTPSAWLIPNLTLGSQDSSGPILNVAVPYGPVFDALYEIATTYQVGMTIELERSSTGWVLKFRSYTGQDRTSAQSVNSLVQFSGDMGSLTNIEELRSIENYKTHTFTFVPSNPGSLATTPGQAAVSGAPTTEPFDMRLGMTFAEDITTDLVGGSAATMLDLLNQRAAKALGESPYLIYVDGEIVPINQFKYGSDYRLGDIVEFVGYSGVTQNARITEYIRSHDETGEKAYPTVTAIL